MEEDLGGSAAFSNHSSSTKVDVSGAWKTWISNETLPPTALAQSLEGQDTQTNTTYSEYSSIGRFPTFQFNVKALEPLSSMNNKARSVWPASVKLAILVIILEVEGPEYVISKRGVNIGKRTARLHLTVGDDTSSVCKMTAWDETAEQWATREGLKKGDVVLIENVSVQLSQEQLMMSASPHFATSLAICYRMFLSPEDNDSYRPDLRLGHSDAAVQKVSSVVAWYKKAVGMQGKGFGD